MLCGGEVVFIATADLHGDLSALAYLAPTLRAYPQAVRVDLGDFAQGNFASDFCNGLSVIEAFNALDYHIAVLGNHDLEVPEKVLHLWQKRFNGVILGAQWQLGKFRPCKSVIFERDGCRVAVIALGERSWKNRSYIWEKFTYQDEAESLDAALKELPPESYDACLLLAHIGTTNYPFWRKLLDEIPEIDAVIGAHSHRENIGSLFGNVPLAQPGARAVSAVKMTFHFDDKKKLRFVSSSLLRPSAAEDREIAAIVRQSDKVSAATGREFLKRFKTPAEFGKFAACAVRRAAGSDAAIIRWDERNFSQAVTVSHIYQWFPFGNRIATVISDGELLRDFLKKRRNKWGKLFVDGDISGKTVRLAISDYLLFNELKQLENARVTDDFERDVILKALKTQEY